ncbi:hypothetical protein FO519_009835 [Halicephalobus sp. NKZ332]|nr:hypothetical protein FO519_009835 [Halicephalobus sp. NKZ332]
MNPFSNSADPFLLGSSSPSRSSTPLNPFCMSSHPDEIVRQLQTDVSTLNAVHCEARIHFLEQENKKVRALLADIHHTHEELLGIIRKKRNEGVDILPGSIVTDVTFKDGSTKKFDLRQVAEQSKHFVELEGIEVGCNLLRDILRTVYGNSIGEYSMSGKTRRGHHFIGMDLLSRVKELVYDGYGLIFGEKSLLSKTLDDALVRTGIHVL